MVDTDLCGSLISATEPGTHVLFCGDVYQLPPVGHGAPLRDMIAANLPYGELSEPHRQGGKITDIVRVCDELTRGLPYQPSRWIDRPRGMNVLHVEATRPVIILEQLKRMLTTLPAEIDPFSDVQILCAVNDVGELGRTTVNLLVQEWLNPHGKKVAGCPFRLGDKVICTSNTVLTVIPKEQSGGVVNGSRDKIEDFVANGEIGRVVHVEEKLFHVKFDAPARTVAVPVFATKSEESNTATGKAGEKAGSGCDFSLGYAVTVHKAQGSQWKIPISLIDSYPGARMVCSRELWVTAISRAEVMPITIGRRDILNRDCQKVALKLRKTFLRELITEGMATSV
jgi:exodeoxyribonuclease V alpha subunit